MNTLGLILNSMHLFFVFFPFLVFIMPTRWFKISFKYIMIGYLIVPLHWIFLDDNCILTLITKKFEGTLNNSTTNSSFSEIYLKWLYKPIMDIFGWKWPSQIDLMVNFHWIFIFIALWYYAFFINQKII